MKRRPAAKTSWLSVVLVIAAVALWALDQKRAGDPPRKSETVLVEKSSGQERAGGYEIYQNCRLVEARNNDGDSFILRLPDGRKAEFRLYFVDTPESAFKNYAGGQSNHERIRQQAAEMGGITSQQAVDIGKKAKVFTLGLLGSAPVTVFTRWDSPFHDERYHAFVRVKNGGKDRWLHELLIERGLGRLKTKPADLPDGESSARQLGHLRDLERQAKRNDAGAWGL